MIVSILTGPYIITQGTPQSVQGDYVKVGDQWGKLCNGHKLEDVQRFLSSHPQSHTGK